MGFLGALFGGGEEKHVPTTSVTEEKEVAPNVTAEPDSVAEKQRAAVTSKRADQAVGTGATRGGVSIVGGD